MSRKVIAFLVMATGNSLLTVGFALILTNLGDVQDVITATSPSLGTLASPSSMAFPLGAFVIVGWLATLWRLFSR